MTTYEGGKEYTQQELLDLLERIKAIVYVRVSAADQVVIGQYKIDTCGQ